MADRKKPLASRAQGFSLVELLLVLGVFVALPMVALALTQGAHRQSAREKGHGAVTGALSTQKPPLSAQDFVRIAVANDWPKATQKAESAKRQIERCAASQDCLRGDGEPGEAGAPAQIDLSLISPQAVECETPRCDLSAATRVSVSQNGEVRAATAIEGAKKETVFQPRWIGKKVVWTQIDTDAVVKSLSEIAAAAPKEAGAP